MGVTFRSGGYIRHVNLGGRTIKEGEAAAVWNSNGIHKQIIGPKRLWLYNSTIRFLTRHKAQSHQYLKVSYCDGRIEHINGPAVLYENPAYHDSVRVKDGLRLNSDLDCVVVTFSSSSSSPSSSPFSSTPSTKESTASSIALNNDEDQGNSSRSTSQEGTKLLLKKENEFSFGHKTKDSISKESISKRIIYGPMLFIPKPSEHVQTFSWSKANKLSSSTTSTAPTNRHLNNENNNDDYQHVNDGHDKDTFQILQTSGTAPFQVTITTVDGFTFDAFLILSYNTTSINDLIQTKDPIDQLYNGLSVDSQTIGDAIPSTSLTKSKKQDVITTLSQVQTYPSLINAANKCGLAIESIQVTTITLCSSLCTQINNEQKLTASIQTEVAKKTHSIKLHQMEMEAREKQIENEAELKKKEAKTDDELDIESHKYKLAAMERKMELEKYEEEMRRDVMKMKEDAVLEFMMKMKREMGVDMTKFMTTYGGMDMVEKVIEKSGVLTRKKIVPVQIEM